MTFPRARLVVSACLFLSWIGFLFFLVLTTPTTILSRPQFLLATLYVVAEIREDHGQPDPHVTITELLWAADPAERKLAGQIVTLAELSAYRKSQGYEGPGKYLIPLQKLGSGPEGAYLVAPIPRVEGFGQSTMLATVEVYEVKEKELPSFAAHVVGQGSEPLFGGALLAVASFSSRKALTQQRIIHLLEEAGASRANVEVMSSRLPQQRFAPVVAIQRLTIRRAEQLIRELADAGAETRMLKVDVRIYPLLPETRRQAVELIARKP